MQLVCIKGFADSDNTNIVCLQGDIIHVCDVYEGGVHCVGVYGWCDGVELDLTPRVVAECFKVKEK